MNMKKIRLRKQQQIKDIYIKYAYEIYKYVCTIVQNKDDSEDIVQNTFVKAYYNIDNLKDEDKMRNWIIRIARNESLVVMKKRVGFIDDILPDGIELQSIINIEGDFAEKELYEKIILEVNNLKQPLKGIITMRYYKKLSFVEIAELLNENPKTIYKMHEKAKEILKKTIIIENKKPNQ